MKRRRNGSTAKSEVGPLEGMNLQDNLDHHVDFNISRLNKPWVRAEYELDMGFDVKKAVIDITANNFLITVLVSVSVS